MRESVLMDQSSEQVELEIEAVSVESVRDHLMKSYGLERMETEKILDIYAESLQDNLQKLQQAMKNGDGEEGGGQAHALKGALLTLGLQKQANRAALLEKELPKKTSDHYETLVEHIICALRPITERIAAA